MQKIVKEGLKVDFHIHSFASSFKDGKKVSNNTIKNIPTLVSKLIENSVNMVAITDHDNFDYALYKELKKEELNNNCIKKIIPGVEFSVKIDNSVVHIIALFDDCSPNIKNIQKYIFNKQPLYDANNCFSEERFLEILRNIDSNVVLIAHQKGTLSSKCPRKNDAKTLGDDKFNELLFLDYFEAYEFKNKRNEIFNKNYISRNKEVCKNINFVTGSDCHNWENYPEKDNDGNFEFSFFKCLPTFRGIMMAVTDTRRIKIGINSFFSKNNSIDKLSLNIGTDKYEIELSEGINAIIGDNSIGKSLLLHKLTEYREISDKKTLINSYNEYLKENEIVVNTIIPQNKIRQFDKQGNIRDIFTNNKTKTKDFLNEYYPPEPNYENEKEIIIQNVNDFIQYIKDKNELIDEKNKLQNIEIISFNEDATSLQIDKINISLKNEERKYNNVLTQIEGIIEKNNVLLKNDLITKDEIKVIEDYNTFLNNLLTKHKKNKQTIINEISKINIINNTFTKLIEDLQETKTENQKARENYNLQFSELISTISRVVKFTTKTNNFKITIKEKTLEPAINIMGEFRFICKADISKIDLNYLKEILLYPLKSTYQKTITDLNNIDPKDFENNIKNSEDEIDKLDFYKKKVLEKVEKDFKIKTIINNKNDINITKQLSSGADSKIYFELLSKDKTKPGIYIIDQPEDDVSQPSIKSNILEKFKQISQNRQIIMITHNPQFVVNLDVDNVIFLDKNQEDKIKIYNGALEYKDSSTDILKIVADNIEGGIDSLKERYKKYDKNN